MRILGTVESLIYPLYCEFIAECSGETFFENRLTCDRNYGHEFDVQFFGPACIAMIFETACSVLSTRIELA